MSEYKILIPSTYSQIPVNNYVEVVESNSEKIKNTESIDTSYNPIPSLEIENNLHSLLQNTFYSDFIDAYKEEAKQKREYLYLLECVFNEDKYFGDISEYSSRIDNILNMLNIKIKPEVLDKLSSYYYLDTYLPVTELTNNTDIKTRWLSDFVKNSYIMRKWAGTTKGYTYLFTSLFHHGYVFLRSGYVGMGSFTELTGKYFKVTNFFAKNTSDNYISKLLPGINSVWPTSVGIRAVQDYSLLSDKIYYKYDTQRSYDDPDLHYDNGLEFGVDAKGLMIELNADSILSHTNSVGTNECLMDNPWLLYVKELLPNVEQASTSAMIGTQISLVASNSGKYIDDPVLQVNGTTKYTHPNIKARFQVFNNNWGVGTTSYLRLGTGSLGLSYFSDDTEAEKPAPTDVSNPVFQSIIGNYDINTINGYQAVVTSIHPQKFEEQRIIPVLFSIAESNAITSTTTTIQLPHTFLAPGNCKFIINLNFYDSFQDITYNRSVVLQESYSKALNKYVLLPSVYEGYDANGELYSGLTLSTNSEITDSDIFAVGEYTSSNTQGIIQLELISLVNPVYADLDHKTGILTVKLKIGLDSLLGKTIGFNGTGVISQNGNLLCSYSTNFSTESSEKTVGITEVGIFNSNNNLVAYGTFPPIIYNTEEFHLTFNCLLELP